MDIDMRDPAHLLRVLRSSLTYMEMLVENTMDTDRLLGGGDRITEMQAHAAHDMAVDRVRDLHTGVRDVSEMMAMMAAQRGQVEVVTSICSIPPVTCYRRKVLRILANLLSNSLKFARDGFVALSCRPVLSSRDLDHAVATAVQSQELLLPAVFHDHLRTCLRRDDDGAFKLSPPSTQSDRSDVSASATHSVSFSPAEQVANACVLQLGDNQLMVENLAATVAAGAGRAAAREGGDSVEPPAPFVLLPLPRLDAAAAADEDASFQVVDFVVADTGVGMNRAELLRACSPYVRASRKKNGGSGLGLYVVKQFVEVCRNAWRGRVRRRVRSRTSLMQAYNGRMVLLSSPFVGTAVVIRLVFKSSRAATSRRSKRRRQSTPLKAGDSRGDGQPFAGSVHSSPRSLPTRDRRGSSFSLAALPPLRALVVDDSMLARRLFKAVVEGLQCAHVSTADNGLSVLDELRRGTAYDVIFMDLNMPVMNGLETASKIREMYARRQLPGYRPWAPAAGDCSPPSAPGTPSSGVAACLSRGALAFGEVATSASDEDSVTYECGDSRSTQPPAVAVDAGAAAETDGGAAGGSFATTDTQVSAGSERRRSASSAGDKCGQGGCRHVVPYLVAVSGDGDSQETVAEALAAGFDDVLCKPAAPERVRAVLEVVGRSRRW